MYSLPHEKVSRRDQEIFRISEYKLAIYPLKQLQMFSMSKEIISFRKPPKSPVLRGDKYSSGKMTGKTD